jgi:hypothetical protein
MNFKKCTLNDFQELSDILEGDKSIHCLSVVKIDMLSWVLKKDNKYVKDLPSKIKYLKEFLSDKNIDLFYNSSKDTGGAKNSTYTQLLSVLDSSLLDLPLLINTVNIPLAKAFLTWRFKISK